MPPNKSTKEPWVMIRGLGREVGHWVTFVDEFKDSVSPADVFALDLPGVGTKIGDIPSTNLSNYVEALRLEMHQLARPPFKVLSISLGGMVAMEWLKKYPEELSFVVLINSSLPGVSPVYHRLNWKIWPDFLKSVRMNNPIERERKVLELVSNNESVREKTAQVYAKLAEERPIDRRVVIKQLIAASTFKVMKSTPLTPVLVLSSLGDRFVDPQSSEDIARLFGWPIERHPWAGHDIPLDDPNWVLDRIKEYDPLSFQMAQKI